MNCLVEGTIVCDCGKTLMTPRRGKITECPVCKTKWGKEDGGWETGIIFRSKTDDAN